MRNVKGIVSRDWRDLGEGTPLKDHICEKGELPETSTATNKEQIDKLEQYRTVTYWMVFI